MKIKVTEVGLSFLGKSDIIKRIIEEKRVKNGGSGSENIGTESGGIYPAFRGY